MFGRGINSIPLPFIPLPLKKPGFFNVLSASCRQAFPLHYDLARPGTTGIGLQRLTSAWFGTTDERLGTTTSGEFKSL